MALSNKATNNRSLSLLLGLIVALGGCSNMISATHDQPLSEDTSTRTTGSLVDDELIEIKALVNISKASAALKGAHVSVTSYNGIVLLSGQVPTEQARRLAEKTTAEIRKVRKIHNELTIAGPTSAIVRANDSWLTTKIKTKMIADPVLQSMVIKVVTENGTVYLMGLVNDTQARQAVDISRNSAGVQKVVKMFEYIR
ncbi:MAG: osmotically-inducible protein OsmY [Motiliproteus sp.]|jgi:osmotically-inducible protein OsmY